MEDPFIIIVLIQISAANRIGLINFPIFCKEQIKCQDTGHGSRYLISLKKPMTAAKKIFHRPMPERKNCQSVKETDTKDDFFRFMHYL